MLSSKRQIRHWNKALSKKTTLEGKEVLVYRMKKQKGYPKKTKGIYNELTEQHGREQRKKLQKYN